MATSTEPVAAGAERISHAELTDLRAVQRTFVSASILIRTVPCNTLIREAPSNVGRRICPHGSGAAQLCSRDLEVVRYVFLLVRVRHYARALLANGPPTEQIVLFHTPG